MDLLHPSDRNSWTRTLHDVNANVWAGVVVVTQATHDHYWQHWTEFLPVNIHPYLQDLEEPQQPVVLQIFA